MSNCRMARDVIVVAAGVYDGAEIVSFGDAGEGWGYDSVRMSNLFPSVKMLLKLFSLSV